MKVSCLNEIVSTFVLYLICSCCAVSSNDRTSSSVKNCENYSSQRESLCKLLTDEWNRSLLAPSPCSRYEKLKSCNRQNTNESVYCATNWKSSINKYVYDVRTHYYMSTPKHSSEKVHFSPRSWSNVRESDRYYTDIVIDARCNFMWPHVYFHAMADCRLGIVPALYGYFSRNPSITSNKSVVLIVDNSTNLLCDGITTPYGNEKCFFSMFRQRLSGDSAKFNCINTISLDHWKTVKIPLIATDEIIWLQSRKEVYAFDNTICLHEFRLIYLTQFCLYCRIHNIFHPNNNNNLLTNEEQRGFLILQRPKSSPRHIPELDLLVHFLHISFPNYPITLFYGNESLCETIAAFHSARVILGAHGSGIVNTLFSRIDTLLLEITSSHPERGNPGPWRTNTYKAVEVGLICRIYIVPHKGDVTDRDLQLRLPIHINQSDFIAIRNIIYSYLENQEKIKYWGISKDHMRSSQYFYDNFLGYFLVNRTTTHI